MIPSTEQVIVLVGVFITLFLVFTLAIIYGLFKAIEEDEQEIWQL